MKTSLAVFHFVLIFSIVFFLGKKWKVASSPLFWSAFFFRLLAAICLGLVYTYYYSASDTWQFFDDAKKMSTVINEDWLAYLKMLAGLADEKLLDLIPTQDFRSIFFVKIISFFCVITLGNYWVCAAYFSLMAFICSWRVHQKITAVFTGTAKASALAFLFFPSVVFWSSGLEKEAIALCGIYFLIYLLLTFLTSTRLPWLFWLLAIIAGYAVWYLKYYWAIVFIISVTTFFVMKFLTSKFWITKKYFVGFWIITFVGVGICMSSLHPNFYLYRFLEVIVSNYNEFVAISNPNNTIHYFQLQQRWSSILINSPWALLSGLFRPVIGEGQGLFGSIASVENFLLLILSIGAIKNWEKMLGAQQQILLVTVLSYCIVLCVFLALSTPNFGTLSRYRVGFLPFFVFLISFNNPIINWISNRVGLKIR